MNNNVLEFFVKMKDLASSGFAKLAQNSKKYFSSINNDVDKTIKKTTDLASSVRGVTDRIRSFGATPPGNGPGDMIKRTTDRVRELNRELQKTTGSGSKIGSVGKSGGGLLGSLASGALRYFAPIAIAGGLMSFGNKTVNKASEFEATNKSYEVLTGDKKSGNKLAGDLNKLQQETILGPEVFKSGQTLLGFGIAAEKVVPTIKMLGDIAMGDAERFNSLTLAFAQMSSAGRLQGQDLLQFVNAGFNPLNVIAKKTGKSMLALRKEMEDGKISSKMVADAFATATNKGGQFNDMMNQMATTTKGKLAMIDGQMENSMIKIGEALAPVKLGLKEFGLGILELLTPHARLQDSIISEKTAVNTLIGAITNVNTSNQVRLTLLEKLKNSYPELFGAIDTETIKNSELLSKLNEINGAYDKRIELAAKLNTLNETKETADDMYKNWVWVTQKAQEKGGGAYWDRRKEEAKLLYENALKDTDVAKASYDVEDRYQRIQKLQQFMFDPMKMAGFKGRDKDRNEFATTMSSFLKYGLESGHGYTWDTLDRMEELMNGGKKVTAAGITSTGSTNVESSTSGKSKKSVADSITSGGPRVININGVKFAEKIELHADSVDGVLNAAETKMKEMFLRILNSGAAVQ